MFFSIILKDLVIIWHKVKILILVTAWEKL